MSPNVTQDFGTNRKRVMQLPIIVII